MSFARYERYKDSGVEWLGEVPVHWEVKRLRFVAELNPSKNEIAKLDRDIEVSFLPMEAVGDDGSLNLDRTRSICEVEMGYTYFREGDVTIAKITPCFENGKGAVMRGLVGGIGFGTTELIVARPYEKQTTSEYLHWLFISTPFRKLGEASMYGAGGQKRMPDDFVSNFSIAFPPREEQSAIATFLDRETAKIDALVAEQQRLIELLKEKRQTVISHAVTKGLNLDARMKDSGIEWLGEVPAHWEVKRLKYIGKAIGGLIYDPSEIVEVGYGTLVLRSSNVQNGSIVFDDNVYVTTTIPENLITQNGDILVCSRNGSRALIGKNAMIDSESSGLTFGAFMMIFRSEYSGYIFHVFNSQLFKFQSGAFLTATINQLTIGNLYSMEVPLPPICEQPTIATFLNRENAKFDALIAETNTAITLLQERRTALISAAVTGKIHVCGLI